MQTNSPTKPIQTVTEPIPFVWTYEMLIKTEGGIRLYNGCDVVGFYPFVK